MNRKKAGLLQFPMHAHLMVLGGDTRSCFEMYNFINQKNYNIYYFKWVQKQNNL